MSDAAARRFLLERLGNVRVLLLALLLDCSAFGATEGGTPEKRDSGAYRGAPPGTSPIPGGVVSLPPWADGLDVLGRAVLLIGRHALEPIDAGREYIAEVLEALRDRDEIPQGVHAVSYAPCASRSIALILDEHGPEHVLNHGPRQTGKTWIPSGALPGLAELHARAGHPLPLKALWLHDSGVNAAAKTIPSLEEWAGLWTVRDDRRLAVLSVGGVEMVHGSFVGTTDQGSAERLRAAAHVVVAEELIPSLSEGAGIEERHYDLAWSSTAGRLPGRRRVSIALTNPGSPDSWPFKRWIEGGGRPGHAAVEIPATDRLTEAEQAALRESFPGSPDLRNRLALGVWSELVLGPAVTPAFADLHIAPARLRPKRNVALVLGHDGGHTPVTIIGSRYQGSIEVYAALASEHAGTRQHLRNLVLPWLKEHAPWVLGASSLLQHYVDPSMATGEQADIDQDPARVIRELLGGPLREGPVARSPRLEPVTRLLGDFNGHTGRPTLQIDPVDGAPLIRALRGAWYYPTVNGKVGRDLPKKPNHPHEDAGDSFCYFVGGIAPSREPARPRGPLYARSETAAVERNTLGRRGPVRAESATSGWGASSDLEVRAPRGPSRGQW
jgi:hypothetical protein